MSKTVTLPPPTKEHLELQARADAAGMSLPDYLVAEWEKTRPRFTKDELIERLKTRIRVPIDAAELVRQGREERDAELDQMLNDVRH